MLVVIPAHDEEDYILGCLNAVERSKGRLRTAHPGIAVHVMVVLDSCTDRSAEAARGFIAVHPGYSAIRVPFGNVGESRALGVARGLARLPASCAPADIWIACTDADTRVPAHWLEEFVAAYRTGADAVTGTVEPERADVPAQLYRRWRERYMLVPGHPHIHGANLGISADAYFGVGGFNAMAAHEDVDLVARTRRAGYRVKATDRLHALTSGRLEGRLSSGFADYLAALASEGSNAAGNSPRSIRAV